jgi:hypothetical protein
MQQKLKQFPPWWYFHAQNPVVLGFFSRLSSGEGYYLPTVAVFIAMIYPYLNKL